MSVEGVGAASGAEWPLVSLGATPALNIFGESSALRGACNTPPQPGGFSPTEHRCSEVFDRHLNANTLLPKRICRI